MTVNTAIIPPENHWATQHQRYPVKKPSRRTLFMPTGKISPTAIAAALSGEIPSIGHAITAAELGERMAAHRRGRYPSTPFGRAAISLYRLHPDQQSPDFVEAFHSWTEAEMLRQDQLRVRMNGMTADELLGETGYIQQIGDDPIKALIAVGELPPHTLISVNGTAKAIECMAAIAVCDCGQHYVKRSWNQRRCQKCRQAARK
jgi:hypothetical protein